MLYYNQDHDTGTIINDNMIIIINNNKQTNSNK